MADKYEVPASASASVLSWYEAWLLRSQTVVMKSGEAKRVAKVHIVFSDVPTDTTTTSLIQCGYALFNCMCDRKLAAKDDYILLFSISSSFIIVDEIAAENHRLHVKAGGETILIQGFKAPDVKEPKIVPDKAMEFFKKAITSVAKDGKISAGFSLQPLFCTTKDDKEYNATSVVQYTATDISRLAENLGQFRAIADRMRDAAPAPLIGWFDQDSGGVAHCDAGSFSPP